MHQHVEAQLKKNQFHRKKEIADKNSHDLLLAKTTMLSGYEVLIFRLHKWNKFNDLML